MKKIYLFLALAIAVAINANADVYLVCDGVSPKDPIVIKSAEGNFNVGEVTVTSDNAWFKLSNAKGDWDTFNDGCLVPDGESFEVDKKVKLKYYNNDNIGEFPTAGTYTVIVYRDDAKNEYYLIATKKKPYHIHTWSWKDGDVEKNTVLNGALTSSEAKTFKQKEDGSYELVFPTPVTLTEGEYFLITYNLYDIIGEDTNVKYFKHDKDSDANTIWTLQDGSNDYLLAAGTYYSATIKDGVLKFNTYAKTTTGLDAVLTEAADYVEIATDIYVQEHHENYYSVYTTESSTYVAPNVNQDTKYYGDDSEKFAKRDWVRIWAPDEKTEKNGMHFAAGTIVEIASGKAVKWGDVVSGETSFTPNLYRPLNFCANETEKDVMYIFQPQQGEVLQVRGKFAEEGENEFLTDEKAEHKVALLGFTEKENKMTVGQWYTLDGHLCGDAVYYTGFATATGVESVETANATVFAANGTINVSSEAQAAIEVYTANGQMVSAINADNASFAVAPGFYLVKVGNQVSKVVVK